MIARIATTQDDQTLLRSLEVPVSPPEPAVDYAHVVVKKPWGYEYLLYENGSVAAWVLYLRPGASTSLHCHPRKRTSLIVLEGEVLCSSLHEQYPRVGADAVMIECGAFHQTTAVSPRGAFVLEVETPPNKGDLVRARDRYGREGMGYEGSDKLSRNLQNYNYLSLSGANCQHNVSRKFGQCSITLVALESQDSWANLSPLSPHDMITVAKGSVRGRDGSLWLSPGDTITKGELSDRADTSSGPPVEVLVTKRVDRSAKVSDLVVSTLKSAGVRRVFIVPGEANVHLLDSIGRSGELEFLCNQTEREASLAAEGYAKTMMDLSVLFCGSGLSAAYAVPGVANCWVDSTPMLVISGQARTDQYKDGRVRQLGNKALDIGGLASPITKYVTNVTEPRAIVRELTTAMRIAREGRPGPVWVDLPIDVQGAVVDTDELWEPQPAVTSPASAEPSPCLTSAVDTVVAWLREAKRPVLLAGNGIRIAGAQEDLLRLVRTLSIPTLVSRRGADLLSEDEPMFFGRPGGYGQRRANLVLQNADLLIAVGTRLSIPLIGRATSSFARHARKVVVDIDEAELGKPTLAIDLPVHASADRFLRAIVACALPSPEGWGDWRAWCEQTRQRFSPLDEGYTHPPRGVSPYLFVDALSRRLSASERIAIDGGPVMNYVMQTFRAQPSQRFITSTGLELAGFGISGAIGSAFASEGEATRIVAICDNRGLLGALPELETIRRYRLPIKIFCLAGVGYSTLRQIQTQHFGGRAIGTAPTGISALDYRGVSNNFELSFTRLDDAGLMGEAISEVLASEGPHLCEVVANESEELIPRIDLRARDDGKWIVKPLEDMYPYLPRDTLRSHMLVPLLEED